MPLDTPLVLPVPPSFVRVVMLGLAMAAMAVSPDLEAQDGQPLATRGTTFWTGFPQNGFGAQHLRVVITSETATNGTVAMPGTGWSEPFSLGADASVVVSVPLGAEHTDSETLQNKGILVTAADSVTVFAMNFQNFTNDLSQLLPIQSLGTSYRVEAYHGLPNFQNIYRSQLLIVATEDDTEVRITPSVATHGGNPPDVPFTVQLDAGQSFQVQAASDLADLTGTLVEATEASGQCRPFVVIGGSMCANIPTACAACDVIFEQLPPISAWGTTYHTVPVQGVNALTYRILAHEDGTSVSIDGGPGLLLNAGEVHEVNAAVLPACIESDKPVSATQFLEGYNCTNVGDPSMLILAPENTLSERVVFRTMASSQVTSHSVSLVTTPDAIGQIQLNGIPVAAGLFAAYPGCADKVHARIPVPVGTHVLQSNVGFTAYVFGTGVGESYAFAAHNVGHPVLVMDTLICADGPVTLNVPEPLDNAVWYALSDPGNILGNGPSFTFEPSANDTIVVSGYVPGSGCPKTHEFPIGTDVPVPALSANGQATITVCQYSPVQLALDPAPDPTLFDIQWSPATSLSDPGIADPIAQPLQDTWYSVTVSSPMGCGSSTDSVLVEVLPSTLFRLSASADADALCQGTALELQAEAEQVLFADPLDDAPGVVWSSIQGGAIDDGCGAVTGSALLFDGAGQRRATTVSMDLSAGGAVYFDLFIAGPGSDCNDAQPGEDVVLEYSINGIDWDLVATYDESAYPTFTAVAAPLPPDAFSVTTRLRWRQLANSGAGQDVWALDNVIITQVEAAGIGFQWSPAADLDDPEIPAPTALPAGSTWYQVTAEDTDTGCSLSDSIFIEVQPAFALTLTADTTICDAGGLQLNATTSSGNGISFLWAPNDGSLSATDISDPWATPSSSTIYLVTATTDIGCVAEGSVTIGVGQLASIQATAGSDMLCQGESTQLTATVDGDGDFVFNWSPAYGLAEPDAAVTQASPTATTTYVITVSDTTSGCLLSDTVTIQVSTNYSLTMPANVTLCSALGHQLSAQHDVPDPQYQWSPAGNLNAAGIAEPSILNNTSATYTLTVSDAAGCSVSGTTTVTLAFDDLEQPDATAFCAGASAVLDAGYPGMTYAWTNGATTQTITVTADGPYTVTITDPQGCNAIRTFPVTVHPLPTVDPGPDLALCGEVETVLDANSPGNSVLWSTGAGTQTITVSTTGTYSVEATNAMGCSASAAVDVAFNPIPVDQLADASICDGASVVLDAGNNGATYLWSTGVDTQAITVENAGSYGVTVTTPEGCSGTFEAQVTLLPMPVVDLGNDTTLCLGEVFELDAGNTGASYLWNSGADTQTLEVQASGTHAVEVYNAACSATDSITITFADAPVDMLDDVIACIDQPQTLDAGNPGASYLWNTGESSQTIAVGTPGTYSVTVTNANGCEDTFDSTVDLLAYPVIDLGPDTALCEGEVLLLDAGEGPGSYIWTTGADTRTIEVRQTGTYGVVVDNGYCASSASISVQFNPSPIRIAARELFSCLDEEPRYVVIDAGNAGSNFAWNTGETSQVILAGAYGWYFVDIINAYDCALRDSVVVNEYCPASIYVPNTFTPNGDGINDIFLPVGKNIASLELIVFDRWGGVLFETRDPNVGWDGTFRGEPVKNDMYIWKMRYRFEEDRDGRMGMEQERMGHIQVLR